MNRFLLVVILCVVSAPAVCSQTAYAKFDSKGRTIGLYKLMADTTGCEASRSFAGTITKVSYDVRGSVYTYTFTLNASGKKVSLNLIATDDEIPSLTWTTSSSRTSAFGSAPGNAGAVAFGRQRRSDVYEPPQAPAKAQLVHHARNDFPSLCSRGRSNQADVEWPAD